jgi:hypothetical protein
MAQDKRAIVTFEVQKRSTRFQLPRTGAGANNKTDPKPLA